MKLHATQQQKLILNQQMTASLNILQMPIQQLKEHIEKEIESNVVIDIIENNQSHNHQYSFGKPREEDISPLLFKIQEQSFQEYLTFQMIEQVDDKSLQKVCLFIIQGLDHRGFFIDSIDDIMELIAASEEDVIKALKIIQSLEPIGVGAENIKECLKLQVMRGNPKNQQIILVLIQDYLEDIAAANYPKISKELNITLSKLHEYIDLIKKLEPIPSQGFYTGEKISYITPDAWIVKRDKEYEITINEQYLPRLLINPTYAKLLKEDIDAETKAYLQKHMTDALSLMKDIENRGSTLRRVIEIIIKFQKEYFNGEAPYKKPMTLKEIAQIVELHESTVSRAVQDKYIDIENNMIRLRDLFVQGIVQDSGKEISVEEVKDTIRDLIDREDKKKPLSDQILYEKIKQEGIEISRRTVAKYRQAMGIGSSTQRRER